MKRMLPLLLAILCLAGCTPAPAEPAPSPSPSPSAAPVQVLQREFALPCYAAGGFHPITGENKTNLMLMPLLYQGLFALDEHFEPQPVLASGQQMSPDGLSWTFPLAPADFAVGVPLTAADVVYSLNLARTAPLYQERLAGISAVKAVEAGVMVTLNRPNGNLPALLDIPILREAADSPAPLGTGDYALELTDGDYALVQKPERASGTLPRRIPLYAVQGADGLIHAFDTGLVSLVTADLTGTNALGYSGNYEAWDYPTTIMLYIGYNSKAGPCKDPAVRKALSYGYERQAVAKSLLAQHATAAALPVPPESGLYDETLAKTLDYAPQTMTDLLAAAGWKAKDGVLQSGRQHLKLRFLVNTDNSYKLAVADYLAAALTRSGIEVDLQKLAWEDYHKALAEGDFDLFLGQTRLTADFDPGALVEEGGSLNFGGYADPETGAALAAFRAATGQERIAAASALYGRLAETAPLTPLCFGRHAALTHWGSMTGLTPTQQNVFYRGAD
ncbi:MAG: ABC transporter substrate-binding protein [Pseudoflavonifractor sp.]